MIHLCETVLPKHILKTIAATTEIESKLIQLQIIDSLRDFNTIYSVKINYQGPNVGISQNPFNLQLQ